MDHFYESQWRQPSTVAALSCESDHIFMATITALYRSLSQRYLTGRAKRGRKCGSAALVLTMALLRPPAQAQPVMKHHGDVIDLKVNSPQVSLGDNGQRAVLLQVE